MSEKFVNLKADFSRLLKNGRNLLLAMGIEQNQISNADKKKIPMAEVKKVNFIADYEPWYTEACRLIGQVIPERLDDFKAQYKLKNRKEITHLTYTISDYIIGLRTSRGMTTVADQKSALVKMQSQVNILSAVSTGFTSKLYDLYDVLQADIFDSELDAAKELVKKGHNRAAGALAGVVLERHLKQICRNHTIKLTSKNPTIATCNDALKDNDVIDMIKWRQIQHLADIRNLCDHAKGRDPSKDEVNDLILGVDKVIKTTF